MLQIYIGVSEELYVPYALLSLVRDFRNLTTDVRYLFLSRKLCGLDLRLSKFLEIFGLTLFFLLILLFFSGFVLLFF
jgi:hypothetical protein